MRSQAFISCVKLAGLEPEKSHQTAEEQGRQNSESSGEVTRLNDKISGMLGKHRASDWSLAGNQRWWRNKWRAVTSVAGL